MEKVEKLSVSGVTYQISDPEKLPMPSNAAVGHMIRVAAVDTQGRVTATECCDAGPELPDGDEVAY